VPKLRLIAPSRIAASLPNARRTVIGNQQGLLRALHLKYHLTTAELLTADQSRRYAELRGYR